MQTIEFYSLNFRYLLNPKFASYLNNMRSEQFRKKIPVKKLKKNTQKMRNEITYNKRWSSGAAIISVGRNFLYIPHSSWLRTSVFNHIFYSCFSFNCRNSRLEVFCKKGALKFSQYF